MKIQYEKIIEDKLGNPLVYNAAFFSVPSLISRGRLNCDSGTKKFLLHTLLKGEYLNHKHRVVTIFTPGHILPGFVIGSKGQWRLIGIETTQAGTGEIDYGLLHDLEQKEDIYIISALDYLVMDALSESLVNSQDAVIAAVQRFNDKYQTRFSPELARSAQQVNRNLNYSIFAIASDSRPQIAQKRGDQQRQVNDKRTTVDRENEIHKHSKQDNHALKSHVASLLEEINSLGFNTLDNIENRQGDESPETGFHFDNEYMWLQQKVDNIINRKHLSDHCPKLRGNYLCSLASTNSSPVSLLNSAISIQFTGNPNPIINYGDDFAHAINYPELTDSEFYDIGSGCLEQNSSTIYKEHIRRDFVAIQTFSVDKKDRLIINTNITDRRLESSYLNYDIICIKRN